MVLLSKFDFFGKEVGKVELVDEFFSGIEEKNQSVKDYIVAIRANKRQWSASTKGRSEVSHSTKKPFRQKGTGNARQGCLAAPQFRGGGIVFGPKPKFDQHVRINRKERRLAIRTLLAQKIQTGRVFVADDQVFVNSLSKPRTKEVQRFLNDCGVENRGILFVDDLDHVMGNANFRLSVRNLPAVRGFTYEENVNGYDLIAARNVVVSEKALMRLVDRLLASESEKK